MINGNTGLVDADEFELEEQNNAGLPFPNQFLWRDGNRFMLNADMALAVDFEGFMTSPETGEVTCNLGGNTNVCPTSELVGFAAEFADDDIQWRTEFRDVFFKITNLGCGAGVCTAV